MGALSEQFLSELCERSFLSLWCARNPYTDHHLKARNLGKELCDLLVVFGNDVLIFSDKSCAYPANQQQDESLDWARWYRRAIKKSCDQLRGAERWIREYPGRLFADALCTVSLPLVMPPTDSLRIHRIAVALGARERCRQFFGGGSGSLMTWSTLEENELRPFTLGKEVCGERFFVHVFDEVTLPIVMRERDTIADFCHYLRKKEELFRSVFVMSPGEEVLVAHYLQTLCDDGEHGFIPAGQATELDGITFEEQTYAYLASRPEYRNSKLANRPSYSWDNLIEYLTQTYRDGELLERLPLEEFERALRAMAATTRVERRALGVLLQKLADRADGSHYHTAWYSLTEPDTVYVGILLPRRNLTDDDYGEFRKNYIVSYARTLKIKEPRLRRALVFATNAMRGQHSETLALIELEPWTAELEAQTREFMRDFNVGHATPQHERMHEFPANAPVKDSREARRRRRQAARNAARIAAVVPGQGSEDGSDQNS
jgi:hypothetical protein